MTSMLQQSVALVNAPSPPVGEGISAGQRGPGRVRGPSPLARVPREPLTRLRFAKPPSPTGGEGERALRDEWVLP
jgi:hypothetical protein